MAENAVQLTLRPFEEPDLDKVADWFPPREDTEAFVPIDWLGTAWRRAREQAGRHLLLLGCRDGEPVSVISVSRNPGEEEAVVSLLVAPDATCSGVGRATLEALRAEFSDVSEFVGYVDPKNTASLALLDRLGWVPAPFDHPDREVFVWRADGKSPPAGWSPPVVP